MNCNALSFMSFLVSCDSALIEQNFHFHTGSLRMVRLIRPAGAPVSRTVSCRELGRWD